MGFAGSMSTAGQWTIVNWLMENRFIDVLVSTGANVSAKISWTQWALVTGKAATW